MIYATIIIAVLSILTNVAVVVFDRWATRQLLAERDAREDKLLQRIQAPQVAVAQQSVADTQHYPQPYIGSFDDDAAAEYEQERTRLERETHDLVASIEGS